MVEWKTCQTCDGKRAFYGETCETCEGVGKVSVSSSTAPTVEVEERAAFEAWAQGRVTSLIQGKFGTGYVYADAVRAWEAWQARAALASKPPAREAAVKDSLTTQATIKESLQVATREAAERLSIDTPEFQKLLSRYLHTLADEHVKARAALIAHIHTWGGAAPAAGNTANE